MHPEDAKTSDVILGLNNMVLIHFIESISSLSLGQIILFWSWYKTSIPVVYSPPILPMYVL